LLIYIALKGKIAKSNPVKVQAHILVMERQVNLAVDSEEECNQAVILHVVSFQTFVNTIVTTCIEIQVEA